MPIQHRPIAAARVSGFRALSIAIACVAAGVASSCKGPPPKARDVTLDTTARDVPDALRGTIGSVTTARNIEPVLVSGYGLVVGLNGTGGGPLPDDLAASMERELGLQKISASSDYQRGTALEGMSPKDVLRSPDVAVVAVFAAIPPGMAQGETFDVYVRAVGDSGAKGPISLEGGMLWTTDLQLGPPTTFKQVQTTKIAQARGPIFINPFAEPNVKDDVTRSQGRILGGGAVTSPLKVTLVLDNDSPALAKAIQSSINSRFGGDPRDPDMIARGRSANTTEVSRWVLEVTVPAKYQQNTSEFLALMRYSQIEQGFADEYAKRYVEALKSQPELGDQLAWALQSLGEPAKPFIRELYDSPEIVPRWSALRAGAGLNDARAIEHLESMARHGSELLKPEAIRLLGSIDGGPQVDLTLRELLKEEELTTRVAAYEALASRAERVEANRRARQYASMSMSERSASEPPELAASKVLRLSGQTIQGVSRRIVADKFIVDRVGVGEPLVYVSQQGRPRIVLFGEDASIEPGALVSGWSNRLMVKGPQERAPGASGGAGAAPKASVYYVDPRTGHGKQYEAPVKLEEFIEFLAHRPTPERPQPGLGFTYSEVVGVLYLLQQGGGTPAAFAVENDDLRARLLRSAETGISLDRAETTSDTPKVRVYEPTETPATGPAGKPSLVVPNTPKPKEEAPKR